MAEKISWTVAVTVTDGPKVEESRFVDVSAYDKLSVVIPGDPAGSGNIVTVAVQPSGNVADILFLYIRSSRYGAALTFDNNGTDIALDGPVLLTGGAVALLASAPDTLTFTNGFGVGNDAEVTILVGRDAAS